MNEITDILDSLKTSPRILENLIKSIPESMLKKRRIPGKWSIHEHACHIIDVQPLLMVRFQTFLSEEKPEFKPFIPGKTEPEKDYLSFDLTTTLKKFYEYRNELQQLLINVEDSFWSKEALHDEYSIYTPRILLRHLLMHDYFHMYRIEELWLTKNDYL